MRAAREDTRRRELSAAEAVALTDHADHAAGLTQRRVVDLGRTGSTRCRVEMPGH